GPVLRARVGELVQLSFFNVIDSNKFPNADTGCDQTSGKDGKPIYPGTGANADTPPDCFNGSVFTNVHYHGTHTNPNSTGDNVFLQIRPSPRNNDATRAPVLLPAKVKPILDEFFAACSAQLPPGSSPKQWPRFWNDMPQSYRDLQKTYLTKYAPDWWKENEKSILQGTWPQYYMEAFPYCFRLPEYTQATWPPTSQANAQSPKTGGAGSHEHDEAVDPQRPLIMGQAPGTHWYHAHKHGSTTINVSNGMTGVFIIEGGYDDAFNAAYGRNWTRTQPVMVINQLGGSPGLLVGGGTGPGQNFSVNGRIQPTIQMKGGEVQLWRIASTSARAGVYFAAPAAGGLQWKQTAQDGVQFADANYQASNSNAFLLASGNRADLLVKAPAYNPNGNNTYAVTVYNTVDPSDRPPVKPTATALTLLTVTVTGPGTPMNFLAKMPPLPPFLTDITASEVSGTKTITYASSTLGGTNPFPVQHTIDGKKFNGEVGVVVGLNKVEEWKVVNATFATAAGNKVSHPFHIHINPFQITEVFDPNDTITTSSGTTIPKYVYSNTNLQPGQCYLNPDDPDSWKPCGPPVPLKNGIWWDVFSIPSGIAPTDAAGQPIKNSSGTAINVPGYFKMRSRFVDYAGFYVTHCHILAHEDRGMMTVVQVAPLQSPYSHH
ncbi:MAG TPA: multicopper oxidase domain-containing protein, partial [Thermoanaerobaculia bacterium]